MPLGEGWHNKIGGNHILSSNDTGEALTATTVRVVNQRATVTVFGDATLITDPPDSSGRVTCVLRYDSRSLFAWMIKNSDEPCCVDLWSPVPADPDHEGTLPWMRITAYSFDATETRHDPFTGGFVTIGAAKKDPRSGDVLRYRRDATPSSTEQAPAEVARV